MAAELAEMEQCLPAGGQSLGGQRKKGEKIKLGKLAFEFGEKCGRGLGVEPESLALGMLRDYVKCT